MTTQYKLQYQSCDGYQENGDFDCQADAVAFLAYWLCDRRGAFDDAGCYAVSADGVGRIVARGDTNLLDLWTGNDIEAYEASQKPLTQLNLGR